VEYLLFQLLYCLIENRMKVIYAVIFFCHLRVTKFLICTTGFIPAWHISASILKVYRTRRLLEMENIMLKLLYLGGICHLEIFKIILGSLVTLLHSRFSLYCCYNFHVQEQLSFTAVFPYISGDSLQENIVQINDSLLGY
jgi:hypothetical protein